MKADLLQVHVSMDARAKKKSMVAVSKMEEELNFYENNFALFQNPSLNYNDLTDREAVRQEDLVIDDPFVEKAQWQVKFRDAHREMLQAKQNDV